MEKKCQDSSYKDDHDYFKCIEKFTRKDMLLLALHQEWVRRRYTKPIYYKTLLITLTGMLLVTLSILFKVLESDDFFLLD